MPEPRQLRRGEDSRRNWETVNAHTRELADLRRLVTKHESAIGDLRSPTPGINLNKFKDQGGGGGITFYGEWVNQVYPKDALVVIRGGTSAGLYISVAAVPLDTAAPSHIPSDPGAIVYWVQLAPGNTMGFW